MCVSSARWALMCRTVWRTSCTALPHAVDVFVEVSDRLLSALVFVFARCGLER